jgi:hypothetical protein
MVFDTYYKGVISIFPPLSKEHETLLNKSIDTLGTEEVSDCHKHYWRLRDDCLVIPEGNACCDQDLCLELPIERFFQPNGYTLSGPA